MVNPIVAEQIYAYKMPELHPWYQTDIKEYLFTFQ